MQTCVAALRLPGRMAAEQVAGCAWNTWPDKRGISGRSFGASGMSWHIMGHPSLGEAILGTFVGSDVNSRLSPDADAAKPDLQHVHASPQRISYSDPFSGIMSAIMIDTLIIIKLTTPIHSHPFEI